MNGNWLRSVLLGGFAAGYIYLFIAVETGGGKSQALVSLIAAAVGLAITFVVSSMARRSST